ncbi:MAG: hypothetical protein GF350_05570 [Chitinivibrionales bacterium]|nr:hypothetical protein [Chitinivibrionales bacterium]
MTGEEKKNIINGLVFYRNRWVSIDKKNELENQKKKCIEKGFVHFQGEWITIEDKISRIAPPTQQQNAPGNIVVNKTVTNQVYNISSDNRTFQDSGEHRHVHLDAAAAPEKTQQPTIPLNQSASREPPNTDNKKPHSRCLEDQAGHLPDKPHEENNIFDKFNDADEFLD